MKLNVLVVSTIEAHVEGEGMAIKILSIQWQSHLENDAYTLMSD